MTAIRYHVFDRKTLTMSDLLAALQANYEGTSAHARCC